MKRLLVALVIIAASRIHAFIGLPWAAEDGLIAFRVARNWSDGIGPYFQATEHVGSVTSLLWTAMLAFGAELGFQIDRWARFLALGLDLLTVVAAWRILGPRVVWFALVFALPLFAGASASGLETPLVTCALAWCAVTPWAVGVLALVRPEGILAGLAFAPGRAWLPWVLGSAVQLGANSYLFGAWVPTAEAKALVYGIHPFAGWFWLAPVIPMGLGQPVGAMEHLHELQLAALPMIAESFKRHWRLATASAVVLLAYWASGTAGFWWYGVPWYAGLAIVACGANLTLPRAFRWCAVAVLLSLQVSGWKAIGALWGSELPLRSIAERLEHERGTVFLEPAGHVGWAGRSLRLVDEVGLITPWVAERRANGEPGWWTDVVRRERPDWIVVRAAMLLETDPKAFAGVGQPVRSRADLDSATAGYSVVEQHGVQASDRSLVLLRRIDAKRH